MDGSLSLAVVELVGGVASERAQRLDSRRPQYVLVVCSRRQRSHERPNPEDPLHNTHINTLINLV